MQGRHTTDKTQEGSRETDTETDTDRLRQSPQRTRGFNGAVGCESGVRSSQEPMRMDEAVLHPKYGSRRWAAVGGPGIPDTPPDSTDQL